MGLVLGGQAELRTGSGLPIRDGPHSSTFSVLFEEICRLVAKRSIGQKFSELTTKTLLSQRKWHIEYGING